MQVDNILGLHVVFKLFQFPALHTNVSLLPSMYHPKSQVNVAMPLRVSSNRNEPPLITSNGHSEIAIHKMLFIYMPYHTIKDRGIH